MKRIAKSNLDKINESGLKSRKLALSILLKTKNSFVNQILSNALNKCDLSERDRRFVSALVLGVIKNQVSLDKIIEEYSHNSINKLPPFILFLLRIALFQLKYMPDIPEFAVLFTSAELAKKQSHIGLVRYVNGLLRNYLRKQNLNSQNLSVEKTTKSQDILDALTSQYSIPKWLVSRWLNRYGQVETISLLEFFQKPAPIVLRTNTSLTTTDKLSSLFNSAGIITERGKLVEDCLTIKAGFRGNPINLPGYKEGLFLIQDEPSAFAALILSPRKTDFVIDLCAAPGGKTLYLAQQMQASGEIIAIDKSAKRLSYLQDKIEQLHLRNIHIKVTDARHFSTEKLADKVLLDAPCSGTGVLHRRQDLRHKRQINDLHSLVSLQRELLENASKLVKPGGILVYSTCSLEPEENIENISYFLKQHPQFEGDDLTAFIKPSTVEAWKQKLLTLEGTQTDAQKAFMNDLGRGILQLLPFRHELSGFFFCRMINRMHE